MKPSRHRDRRERRKARIIRVLNTISPVTASQISRLLSANHMTIHKTLTEMRAEGTLSREQKHPGPPRGPGLNRAYFYSRAAQ